MSALTVAEAITRVADLLDDPGNRRWSTAKVTGALKTALSVCVQEYGDVGGTAFDESITGTTTSTGALVIASPVISRIKSLQVVTGIRQLQQHEQVGHSGDCRLALADADRLHDHDVETCRLAHQRRLARLLGHPAERAAGRAWPDVGGLLHGQPLHAGLVAED